MRNNDPIIARNLSPHYYVAVAVVVTFAAFFFFLRSSYFGEYFYVPALLIALAWGLANGVQQWRGRSQFAVDRRTSWPRILRRALPRYVVWGALCYAAIAFYRFHPFYTGNAKTLYFLEQMFRYYLWLGVPYFVLTLRLRGSRTEDFYDPAMRLMLVIKHTLALPWRPRRSRAVWRNKTNRKALLNLLARLYFIPVMVEQIFTTFVGAGKYAPNDFNHYDILTLLFWFTAMLWLMDTLAASAAYSLESRWMENRSRSVDLTALGWLVCLACYNPINSMTSAFFPFGPSIGTSHPESYLLHDTWLIYAVTGLQVTVLAFLVYADLSLGPSGANITLKRLQTRGPYSLVRHPATVCKISLWWLQAGMYSEFWTPLMVFGQLGWTALYLARALTEERHLSQFEEYRAYQQQVRYRFIPGVV